jgi:hypothetical protein
MPQQTPTDIKKILDPLNVPDSVKATVWDAYHNANTPEEFQAAFDKINLPKETKAALWDSRFSNLSQTSTGLVVPSTIAPQPTPGYFKESLAGIGRGISGLGTFIEQTLTPHATAGGMSKEENAKIGPLGRLIYNPPADILVSLEQAETSREASERSGESRSGQSLAYLENSPVGGLVRKAEQAGPTKPGEIFRFQPATAGAVTEGATMYAAPKVATELIRTPAEIKAQLKKVTEPTREFARGLVEARPAVKSGMEKAIEIGKRQDMEAGVERQATDIKKNTAALESKVYAEANRRFEALKEKIGADKPGEPLADTSQLNELIQGVQNNMLPEESSLLKRILKLTSPDAGELTQLRRDVMNGQGMKGSYEDLSPQQKTLVDDIASRYSADISQGDPATWRRLQNIKTSIDKAIQAPSTSYTMKQALGLVSDKVVDMMGRMAEEKGAGKDWEDAKQFYTNWREDFHQTKGQFGSGSPIAEVLKEKDPMTVVKSLSRTQGPKTNRALDILRRYQQFGGNELAGSVEKMMKERAQTSELLKKSPDVKAAGQEKPTIDPEHLSRKAIGATQGRIGRLNVWDARVLAASAIAGVVAPFIGLKGSAVLGGSYVLGKIGMARALENEKVVKWLAETPPREIEALQKLPGADRVKIAGAITNQVVKSLKDMDFSADQKAWNQAKQELGSGADFRKVTARAQEIKTQIRKPPITVSQQAREFLGAANTAAILGAMNASKNGPVQKTVQNRREALEAVPRP